MAAYRPLGPFPQFFLADGTVNNGGLIHFYETDLTTPKDTYSDQGLSTPNSNPVQLDSAGRPVSDIWGSDAYGVVITDSLGANPQTRNNVQPDVGSGASIPTLVNGDFLTNNGSVLLWETITQVPDPSGFPSGSLLNTDGTLVYWATPAASGSSGVAGKIIVGAVMIQYGSGTAAQPTSGSHNALTSLTFPTAFSAAPKAFAIPVTSPVTNAGGSAIASALGSSATAASFNFEINDFSNNSGGINTNIVYNWIAIGLA